MARSKLRDKPVVERNEIKITRAMITAGVYVLQGYDPEASQDREVVQELFEAMLSRRKA